MFNSLTGTVTGKFPQKLLLETNGVEWDLCVPDSNLEKIPDVGQKAKIFTYLQHTDVLMNLFGFATESDRCLFFDLLKVDGIGPKAAIKIMGSISTLELAKVLEDGDLARLEKVPGVGKKTAAKMLLQLKGRLTLENTEPSAAKKQNSEYAEVITALVNMGYEKNKVSDCVNNILLQLKNDDEFMALTQIQKEDALLRRVIVEMAG